MQIKCSTAHCSRERRFKIWKFIARGKKYSFQMMYPIKYIQEREQGIAKTYRFLHKIAVLRILDAYSAISLTYKPFHGTRMEL